MSLPTYVTSGFAEDLIFIFTHIFDQPLVSSSVENTSFFSTAHYFDQTILSHYKA